MSVRKITSSLAATGATLVLLIAAFPAAAASSGVAASEPSDDLGPNQILVSPEEARENDIRLIAANDPSRTLEEIRDDVAASEALWPINEKLRKDYGHVVSYAETVKGAEGPEAIVHLSAPAPAGLTALLASLPIPVETRIDQQYSAKELARINSTIGEAVFALPEVVEAYSRYDIEQRRIIIRFNPATGADGDAVVAAATAVARAAAATINVNIPVDIIIDPSVKQAQELMSGGTSAGGVLPSGGFTSSHVCTFAFTGIDGSGRHGNISARHCTADDPRNPDDVWTRLTYENRYAMAAGAVASAATGDAQFHIASNDTGRPYYIYDKTSSGLLLSRAVSRLAVPSYNDNVYGYGASTAKQVYGNIKGYDALGSDGTRTIQNLVVVTRHPSTDGDSGGPWFFGSTGFGVHHGGIGNLEGGEMYFSAITDVAPSMGVRVNLG